MPKKRKKHTALKIVLAVVLLLFIAGAGITVKSYYEQSKMNPLATSEVIPGIIAVKDNFVNLYLIKSGDKYIAIDAGMVKTTVEKELKNLGISESDVAAVLLTHNHGDHIGALELFKNADIYIGAQTPGKPADYIPLTDGESIQILDSSIQCIATPGHTDGSVCFLIDNKYLFIGDTLSLAGSQVGLFNSFYNKSDKVQAESIKKLSALKGFSHIFTAHYGFAENNSLTWPN